MRKVTILTLFLVLLMFSSIQGKVLAQYRLPEHNKTVGYVLNLIDSYNELLKNSTYINRPDFDSIKENLTLYHDVQHSFQVVVLQSSPYNSDHVALIFATIQSNRPNVVMDYNDTFNNLFPYQFATLGKYVLLEKNVLTYANSKIEVPLILFVLTADISGDYFINAKDAAQFIYQQDVNQIPNHMAFKPTISDSIGMGDHVSANVLTPTSPSFVTRYLATTTVSITVETSQNPIYLIINDVVYNPLFALGAIGIGAYFLLFQVIPSIWGSDIEFYNQIKKKLAKRNEKQEEKEQ